MKKIQRETMMRTLRTVVKKLGAFSKKLPFEGTCFRKIKKTSGAVVSSVYLEQKPDAEFIELAKKTIEDQKLNTRRELWEVDPYLYRILRTRGLLDEVGFAPKRRSWKGMSDGVVVDIAKETMKELGISTGSELSKADQALYFVLNSRGLLNKLGFEPKAKPLEIMNDDELVESANRVMEDKGITGKGELQNADSELYGALRKRGLLDEVGLEPKTKSWAEMNDAELVQNVAAFVSENDITSLSQLRNQDAGLYDVLWKRKLLGHVKLVKSD